MPERGEFGYTLDQYRTAAEQGGLPWGQVVAEPQPWHVDVITAPWRFTLGAVDSVVGVGLGFAALGGYSPDGGMSWETAGAAWTNLGKLALAAGTYLTPAGALRDQLGAVPFLEPGEGGRLLTETGKALVAWDQWDDDPARAGGLAVTNIAVALVGTRGVGAGLKVAGVTLQAGRSAGVAAHVGAGLTRVGEAIGRLPTIDKLVNEVIWRRNAPDTAPPGVVAPDVWHRLGDTAPDAPRPQPTPEAPHSLADELGHRPDAGPTATTAPDAPTARPETAQPDARPDESGGDAAGPATDRTGDGPPVERADTDSPADPAHAPGDGTPAGGRGDLGNQPDGSWVGEQHGRRLDLDPHANRLGDDVLLRAADAERTITPQITQIVDAIDGAQMRGYEYVLKSEDSLKRKIATELLRPNSPTPEVAAAKVRDAVRYTIEMPANAYRAGTVRAVDALLARGFENVKFDVNWHLADKYKGVNTTWRDPRGCSTLNWPHCSSWFWPHLRLGVVRA